MLFLDLKDFGVFDTFPVYGQSRSGTVAVALWHCGTVAVWSLILVPG